MSVSEPVARPLTARDPRLAPWRALGDEGCDRLLACMRPIVARVVEHEAVAFPNPMGLPAPRS